jgi:putative ABC transport system permease protein
MSLFRLSWKNLTNKPLTMLLTLTLFALGVGLISLLLLVNKQVEEKFEKNLAGINLVIGAKGSPLQLILASMYHIDAPTGNIPLKAAKPFLNPKHPFIKTAVPLSLGDNYRGYRIVGTTPNFLDLYQAKMGEGRMYQAILESVVGAVAAKELNLKIGDTFESSHGLIEDSNLQHHGHAFKVVGILEPTGSAADLLILTAPQTIWDVHDHEGADTGEEAPAETTPMEEEAHDHKEGETHDDHDHADHDHEAEAHAEEGHEDHDHEGHDHEEGHEDHAGHDHEAHDHSAPLKPITEYEDKDITSVLLQFKGNNVQTLNMQRNINENTEMQAATPAIEINRLYSMMGVGADALRWLALVIMGVSGLSIFISLFSSLRDRRYELALMRTMGASPGKLFSMVVLEGLILAVLGFVLGILLSHGAMSILAGVMKSEYRYSFSGGIFLQEEFYLLLGALFLGFVAALIPALQASKTDISKTLSEA